MWEGVFLVAAAIAALMAWQPGSPPEQSRRWLCAIPYVGVALAVLFTNRFPRWASQHWRKAGPISQESEGTGKRRPQS